MGSCGRPSTSGRRNRTPVSHQFHTSLRPASDQFDEKECSLGVLRHSRFASSTLADRRRDLPAHDRRARRVLRHAQGNRTRAEVSRAGGRARAHARQGGRIPAGRAPEPVLRASAARDDEQREGAGARQCGHPDRPRRELRLRVRAERERRPRSRSPRPRPTPNGPTHWRAAGATRTSKPGRSKRRRRRGTRRTVPTAGSRCRSSGSTTIINELNAIDPLLNTLVPGLAGGDGGPAQLECSGEHADRRRTARVREGAGHERHRCCPHGGRRQQADLEQPELERLRRAGVGAARTSRRQRTRRRRRRCSSSASVSCSSLARAGACRPHGPHDPRREDCRRCLLRSRALVDPVHEPVAQQRDRQTGHGQGGRVPRARGDQCRHRPPAALDRRHLRRSATSRIRSPRTSRLRSPASACGSRSSGTSPRQAWFARDSVPANGDERIDVPADARARLRGQSQR